MDNPIVVFLAAIGALTLGNIIYKVLLEWKREGKDNPLHLDRDTLDQIQLEREGKSVGWKDGTPVISDKELDDHSKK